MGQNDSWDGVTVRPRRHYAIHCDGVYSLRDAARVLNVPEEQLRRLVLMGDLPAIDCADDRQYLLRGSVLQEHVRKLRPREEAVFEIDTSAFWALGIFLLLPILASAGLAFSVLVGNAGHEARSGRRVVEAGLPERRVEAPGPSGWSRGSYWLPKPRPAAEQR